MSETIEIIKSNCPRDCYDGCGISIEKINGRISRVMGDEAHPDSRGRLCNKYAIAYNGVWQDETERLLHPLKRIGEKGRRQFERISWEEAIVAITDRLKADVAAHGPASILHTHYSGTLSLIALLFPMRFFLKLGASEVDPDSICNAAGHTALSLLYGESHVGFDPRTIQDSNCVLIWGANPSHSGPHSHTHWFAASKAKKIVVDPLRTNTAQAAYVFSQFYRGPCHLSIYALDLKAGAGMRHMLHFLPAHGYADGYRIPVLYFGILVQIMRLNFSDTDSACTQFLCLLLQMPGHLIRVIYLNFVFRNGSGRTSDYPPVSDGLKQYPPGIIHQNKSIHPCPGKILNPWSMEDPLGPYLLLHALAVNPIAGNRQCLISRQIFCRRYVMQLHFFVPGGANRST